MTRRLRRLGILGALAVPALLVIAQAVWGQFPRPGGGGPITPPRPPFNPGGGIRPPGMPTPPPFNPPAVRPPFTPPGGINQPPGGFTPPRFNPGGMQPPGGFTPPRPPQFNPGGMQPPIGMQPPGGVGRPPIGMQPPTQTIMIWRCSKCQAKLAEGGPEPRHITRCPQCGCRFTDGIGFGGGGGFNQPVGGGGGGFNQPAAANVAPALPSGLSARVIGLIVGAGFVVITVVVGGIAALWKMLNG